MAVGLLRAGLLSPLLEGHTDRGFSVLPNRPQGLSYNVWPPAHVSDMPAFMLFWCFLRISAIRLCAAGLACRTVHLAREPFRLLMGLAGAAVHVRDCLWVLSCVSARDFLGDIEKRQQPTCSGALLSRVSGEYATDSARDRRVVTHLHASPHIQASRPLGYKGQ